MRQLSILAACAALGACVLAEEPEEAAIPQDECGAAGLQGLVGGPVPAGFEVPGPVRIYASGDPVTLDYNPRRLNVETDPARRQVVMISCG